MACPICDQKPMNCDCTPEEKRQYEEIGDLEDEVERLRADNTRLWKLINEMKAAIETAGFVFRNTDSGPNLVRY